MSEDISRIQHGGNHYKSLAIEPWDAMESWLSHEEFKGFLKGNAIKYLARSKSKDSEDLNMKKANHYLQKLNEVIDKQLKGTETTPKTIHEINEQLNRNQSNQHKL